MVAKLWPRLLLLSKALSERQGLLLVVAPRPSFTGCSVFGRNQTLSPPPVLTNWLRLSWLARDGTCLKSVFDFMPGSNLTSIYQCFHFPRQEHWTRTNPRIKRLIVGEGQWKLLEALSRSTEIANRKGPSFFFYIECITEIEDKSRLFPREYLEATPEIASIYFLASAELKKLKRSFWSRIWS